MLSQCFLCAVQAVLKKLPAAGSLLFADEYFDIDATEQKMSDNEFMPAVPSESDKCDEFRKDEGEQKRKNWTVHHHHHFVMHSKHSQ